MCGARGSGKGGSVGGCEGERVVVIVVVVGYYSSSGDSG